MIGNGKNQLFAQVREYVRNDYIYMSSSTAKIFIQELKRGNFRHQKRSAREQYTLLSHMEALPQVVNSQSSDLSISRRLAVLLLRGHFPRLKMVLIKVIERLVILPPLLP
jgi:hypothetical protein